MEMKSAALLITKLLNIPSLTLITIWMRNLKPDCVLAASHSFLSLSLESPHHELLIVRPSRQF